MGITQSDLARRLGVSRQAVHQVIAGRIRSERIERAICAYSGVARRRLFPTANARIYAACSPSRKTN